MKRAVLLALFASAAAAADEHLAAAKTAESVRNFAAAEKEYEASLAKRTDAEVLQRLGLARHLQNKYSEAISAFQKALELNPHLWGAQLFLGIDYYRTNQFEKALTQLNLAHRERPKEPEIQFWLGATHLALHHELAGLEILEELIQQQPANKDALRLLAEHYAAYGTSILNAVAEKFPDTAAGYQVHGQALEFEGADEAALEAWRMALLIEPSRPGLHLSIGRVLWRQGKAKEALAEFERELAIQPRSGEAHQLFIAAAEKSGQEDKVTEEQKRWARITGAH